MCVVPFLPMVGAMAWPHLHSDLPSFLARRCARCRYHRRARDRPRRFNRPRLALLLARGPLQVGESGEDSDSGDCSSSRGEGDVSGSFDTAAGRVPYWHALRTHRLLIVGVTRDRAARGVRGREDRDEAVRRRRRPVGSSRGPRSARRSSCRVAASSSSRPTAPAASIRPALFLRRSYLGAFVGEGLRRLDRPGDDHRDPALPGRHRRHRGECPGSLRRCERRQPLRGLPLAKRTRQFENWLAEKTQEVRRS